MAATAVAAEGSSVSAGVTGCQVTTDKFEVTAYRVSGAEQALLHPDTEAWAAPYTWLNTDIRISKPFEAPVTGILGATYPLSMTAQQLSLRPDGAVPNGGASIDGEPSYGGRRHLTGHSLLGVKERGHLLLSAVGDLAMGNIFICSLYVAGSCVQYDDRDFTLFCRQGGVRQICRQYDQGTGKCVRQEQVAQCLDTYHFQVQDSAGLTAPVTVGLPADVTTVGDLISQVQLATGKTVLALKYNGQALDPASGSLASVGQSLGWPPPNANPPPTISLTAYLGASQSSDPLITGFDGSQFHFDEVGEYNMLWEASGLKVDASFEGTGMAKGGEKSFVRAVRVITPNGKSNLWQDLALCKVALTPAGQPSKPAALSPQEGTAKLEQMAATAVAAQGSGVSAGVTGCHVTTDKFEVTVYRVSGAEQALLHPDSEAWAAPYTWLNTDIRISKPFEAPVTGILGATYPLSMTAQQLSLRSEGEAPDGGASIDGEPSYGGRRLLTGQSLLGLKERGHSLLSAAMTS
ncbi:hypothetical protein N2152v2_005020 [Parachlorella kessleri]